FSFEPRASMRYEMKNNQALTFGYGLHSQLQLPGVYFAQLTDGDGNKYYPNQNLDFSKAHHFVTGYEINFNKHNRIKVETYLQQLFHIPVGAEPGSTLSTVNQSYGLISSPMVNKGIGQNYGVELTVERFLHKGLYYLLSASLYNSRYQTLT